MVMKWQNLPYTMELSSPAESLDHSSLFNIFYHSFILHLLREHDKADTNSLRWSVPVTLEHPYTHMRVARSTTATDQLIWHI